MERQREGLFSVLFVGHEQLTDRRLLTGAAAATNSPCLPGIDSTGVTLESTGGSGAQA